MIEFIDPNLTVVIEGNIFNLQSNTKIVVKRNKFEKLKIKI